MKTPKRRHTVDDNGCWITGLAPNAKGYIYFAVGGRGGKRVRAHRYMWEQKNGPIPKGMMVLHSCDNRECINPDHLRIGTAQDNMDDMMARDRHANQYRAGLGVTNGTRNNKA